MRASARCATACVVQSFLDDGEYARLVHGWIVEHIQPLVRACMEAAERAGDLRPGASRSPDDFWFVHHVAAGIAHGRLPERGAYPYAGGCASWSRTRPASSCAASASGTR